jgi:hypothetical protein
VEVEAVVEEEQGGRLCPRRSREEAMEVEAVEEATR